MDIQKAADDSVCELMCGDIPEEQMVEYLIALIECVTFQLKVKLEIKI